MLRFLLHSSRRIAFAAAALPLLIAASGCQIWGFDRWNFDRLRDERAVDVERRLERNEPIIKNPF